MPDGLHLSLIIAILFAMTVITRLLPFIFTRQMKDNHLIAYLGKYLPIAIIFLLAIYYMMSIAKPHYSSYLIRELIAVVVIIFCHWRWRQMMVSLMAGTAVYLSLQLI